MSHHLEISELKKGQLILVALEKDEGCFLNQNFPTPPHNTFWLGGTFVTEKKNELHIEIKVFKDLSTLDMDSPIKGISLIIPKEIVAQSWWYCGSSILFLKTIPPSKP